MTLTEIRLSIVNQLGQLTLDDIFTDPQLDCMKQSFINLANIAGVDEIGNFLFGEFLNTCQGNLCFNLQKANEGLKSKLFSFSPDLTKLQRNARKYERDIEYYQRQLNEFPKQKTKLESELEEINKEIEKIIPPADDSPDVQLAELNKLKNTKTSHLQQMPGTISFYQSELVKMQEKHQMYSEKINDIETEEKNIEEQMAANQQSLQSIKDTNPDYYENEYRALVFLYRILLQKNLARKRTGTYEERGNRVNETGKSWESFIAFSADIYEAEITDIAKEKIIAGLTDLVRSENIIPDNWREIIYAMLNQTIPDISGKIGLPEDNTNSSFKKRTSQLTFSDTSALLALKIGCQKNQSLNIAGNKIILALQGGVAATLLLREKGAMINSFQKKPFEIYFNHLQKQKKCQTDDLYETNETTTVKGKILMPEGYYILSGNYVVEIYFDLWPGGVDFDWKGK